MYIRTHIGLGFGLGTLSKQLLSQLSATTPTSPHAMTLANVSLALLNKSELGICKAHQCQPDVWNRIRKHLGPTAPIATYLDFALLFNKTHF